LTKSERWILSEWQVAEHRELAYGEKLLRHRQQTPFAEIDLLFNAGPRLSLIEVKTWSGELWGAPLLTAAQGRRLFRARDYLESRYSREVTFNLAVVSVEKNDALSPTIRYFGGESLVMTPY
jgi:Holliday junction resolvase-like predicted endonuclease